MLSDCNLERVILWSGRVGLIGERSHPVGWSGRVGLIGERSHPVGWSGRVGLIGERSHPVGWSGRVGLIGERSHPVGWSGRVGLIGERSHPVGISCQNGVVSMSMLIRRQARWIHSSSASAVQTSALVIRFALALRQTQGYCMVFVRLTCGFR